MTNSGTFTNSSLLINQSGATLTNTGTLTNNASFGIGGTFTNYGAVNGSSTFTNDAGAVYRIAITPAGQSGSFNITNLSLTKQKKGCKKKIGTIII